MSLVTRHDLSWAYSMRRFVDTQGNIICDDNWDSIGAYCLNDTKSFLVDPCCFAVSRDLAKRVSYSWTQVPIISDRNFFKALYETGVTFGTTGLSTVNYRVGLGSASADPEKYLKASKWVKDNYPQDLPWRREQIWKTINLE